jgi:hypothetical protein
MRPHFLNRKRDSANALAQPQNPHGRGVSSRAAAWNPRAIGSGQGLGAAVKDNDSLFPPDWRLSYRGRRQIHSKS